MSLKNKALTLGVGLAALIATTAGAYAATAFATTSVNVRRGPGPDYRVVDVLRRGEAVEIDYCRGSWCAISKPGPDGWVSANYLSRDRGYDDDYYRPDDHYGDDYYEPDDYYDDDFYIDRPRVIRRYPIIRRHYDPGFSACIGGPNASFCISD